MSGKTSVASRIRVGRVPDDQPCEIEVLVSITSPSVIVTERDGDRVRLVMAEGLRGKPLQEAVEGLLQCSRWELPGLLRDLSFAEPDSSLCVADVFTDGTLHLGLGQAPPGIVLSPRRAARTTDVVPAGGMLNGHLDRDETLLLCSSSFLESPVPSFLRLRDPLSNDEDVSALHDDFQSRTGRGALVSACMREMHP